MLKFNWHADSPQEQLPPSSIELDALDFEYFDHFDDDICRAEKILGKKSEYPPPKQTQNERSLREMVEAHKVSLSCFEEELEGCDWCPFSRFDRKISAKLS